MGRVRQLAVRLSVAIAIVLAAIGGGAGSGAERAAVRLAFVGDVMLDGLPGKAIADGQDPFAPFAAILKEADIRVANLECAIGTGGTPMEGKRCCFRAAPRCVGLLARHFDAVSLANNHAVDYGSATFLEQLGWLKEKVGYFGGGRDLREAHEPWIVQRRGLRVALLAYNDYHPREFEAGPDKPGIAWSVEEQVIADINACRTRHKADLVIPFMHWGEEHEPQPNQQQCRLARKMIDAGADLIVGSHPHVTQGSEVYHGRLIVYSLGNFVFDGFEDDDNLTGWLLRVTLPKNGLAGWDTIVAKIDRQGLPRLAGGAVKREWPTR